MRYRTREVVDLLHEEYIKKGQSEKAMELLRRAFLKRQRNREEYCTELLHLQSQASYQQRNERLQLTYDRVPVHRTTSGFIDFLEMLKEREPDGLDLNGKSIFGRRLNSTSTTIQPATGTATRSQRSTSTNRTRLRVAAVVVFMSLLAFIVLRSGNSATTAPGTQPVPAASTSLWIVHLETFTKLVSAKRKQAGFLKRNPTIFKQGGQYHLVLEASSREAAVRKLTPHVRREWT